MSSPHAGQPATAPAGTPETAPAPAPASNEPAGRPHLVVVRTRAAASGSEAAGAAVLITRFWHPRDRTWNENSFESLEHALRLFVDESGWILLQQQALDGVHAYELIFEAHRIDFSRPSTEQMLRDIGMAPEQVAEMLERPPTT